ncbi:hypothetical protein [Caudoviricetes sp.]|nr:hypothetical protein [Caudoviricetes sp.]UOF81124.1 hypothetical protein [Caudoviricetes sp.]UOF82240.1 hypothetical protein [Caudoviricetes sp.]UOF82469.1 hypothetical protein [Caudoviricetes sp.]UOF82623.1 hypothetical protein [Caudoviricetes sp.]
MSRRINPAVYVLVGAAVGALICLYLGVIVYF